MNACPNSPRNAPLDREALWLDLAAHADRAVRARALAALKLIAWPGDLAVLDALADLEHARQRVAPRGCPGFTGEEIEQLRQMVTTRFLAGLPVTNDAFRKVANQKTPKKPSARHGGGR